MEEQVASVNSAPSEVAEAGNAGQQEDVQASTVNTEDTGASQEQTEIPAEESRIDKAFAARLRKEQEKLEAKYAKHNYVIEKAAAEFGMSVDDYLNDIEKGYREKEFDNLDPKAKEDLLWAREQRQKEAENKRWNDEISSLRERFPDVKSAKDIPDEVLEARLKDGVSLRYAYADYMLGKERTKIEQETIKNLQDNVKSSVGSLGSVGTDNRMKISEMSQDDFNKLKEEVLRGTRRSL